MLPSLPHPLVCNLTRPTLPHHFNSTQDEIHSMLLQFAEAGATVVRLKGGDPYVFGRGGEEVAYLSARGIQVHCVPGITAAAGICAGTHHCFLSIFHDLVTCFVYFPLCAFGRPSDS